MPPNVSNAVLLKEIEIIKRDVEELKTSDKETAKAIQDFLVLYSSAHSAVVNEANRAHTRIDDVKEDVDDLQEWKEKVNEAINTLMLYGKVGTWVFGILGVSIIGLIISLITGQATITFN